MEILPDWINSSVDFKYWLLQTVAMLLTCLLLPKLTVSGPIPAFLTVLSLSFVNAHLWDSALFFKIPNEFAYKALLLVLTNGFFFWIIVKLLPGIEISGILPAILAPIIFSILSLLIDQYKEQIDLAAIYSYIADHIKLLRTYFADNKQTFLRLEDIMTT